MQGSLRSKSILLCAFLLFALSLATSSAAAGTLLGGETKTRKALRVAIGYPYVEVAYQLPLSRTIDISPNFSFFFGHPAVLATPVLGNNLGAEFRFNIIRGKFSLAFLIDLKIGLVYTPHFAVDIQLGTPSVVMGYRFHPKVAMNFGYLMPISFVIGTGKHSHNVGKHHASWAGSHAIHGGFFAAIPIAFRFGVEWDVHPKFRLLFNIDVGPSIIAHDSHSHVDPYLIARIGFAYMM